MRTASHVLLCSRRKRGTAARFCAAITLTSVAISLGCAYRTAAPAYPPPLRISEVVDQGDAARRASSQLTLQGLDADAEGLPNQAMGHYLRAIQVDPNNPYAYLAIARHRAAGTDPIASLPFLDKSIALFSVEVGGQDPRVAAHLEGLRGQALHASGEFELARVHLERARAIAPSVWSDGWLSAQELL